MTTELKITELGRAFAAAVQTSEESPRFDSGSSQFCWQAGRDSPWQVLYEAVNDLRQRIRERGLSPGTRAARDGQETLADFIAAGGTFTLDRDSFGLDAGYYIARACLDYDFVALGEIARSGALGYVAPVRYYNRTPEGPALFRAALGAGLRFSKAADSEGRTAGFYVARCGDPELVALYRQAGGTFDALDREILTRETGNGSAA